MKTSDIQIRDPFILPLPDERRYLLFGSTDKNIWSGPGTGFDCYESHDRENWEGPIPAFRPPADFWANSQFWAPECHPWQGRHFLFASFAKDGQQRGTQILAADNPEGPYRLHSDRPVTPRDWECLDGTLFVDDAGKPWMVFGHKWVQVEDGEMCAIPLTDDLRAAVGEPTLRFRASEAAWSKPFKGHGRTGNRVTDPLRPGESKEYAACGSRAYIPFFNVGGEHAGAVCALGWTGRRLDAHNALRRHLVRNMPKGADGQPQAPICFSTWGGMKTATHLKLIEFIKKQGVRYDLYWIDAGWYKDHPEWGRITWDGIAPCVTPLFKDQTTRAKVASAYLDDPATAKFIADTIGGLMKEHGADCYREDTSFPCGHPDEPGRDGIGEMEDYPFDWHRRMLEEFQTVKPFLWGDFYPLTGCDTATDGVLAYQLDRPDLDSGVIFAFRRQDRETASFRVAPELEQGVQYIVEDIEGGTPATVTGGEAFEIAIADKRGSRLILYRKDGATS